MKHSLHSFLAERETFHSREIGWASEQDCTLHLSRDGAWYAGPLHVNPGVPVPGCARVLRYALHAGRASDRWFESLSVLVFSETGTLLARLNLPGAFSPERLREIDVRGLNLPMQSKLRLLFKTPCAEGKSMRSADQPVETWLSLAA